MARGGWNQARPSGHSSTSAGRLSTPIGPGSEVEWEWYPAAGRQPDGSFLLYNPAPAGAEQHVQLEASRAAGPFAF